VVDYYLEPIDYDPFAQPMAPTAVENEQAWQSLRARAAQVGLSAEQYLKLHFDNARAFVGST
jgi:hypothetical protein